MPASAWPPTWAVGLQAEMLQTYQWMQQLITAQQPNERADTPGVKPKYVVPLTTANSSQGRGSLITNQATALRNTKALCDFWYAQGFRATIVTVAGSLLDPSNADYLSYRTFYQNVTNYVRATYPDMHYTVSCGTGGVPGVFRPYTIDQSFAIIRSSALWIAQHLVPDTMSLQNEVSTDQLFLSQCVDARADPNPLQFTKNKITAPYWTAHHQTMMSAKPNPAILYTGGACPQDYHDVNGVDYWDHLLAASSPVAADLFEAHPFPERNYAGNTGGNLFNVLLNRFNSAVNQGRRITCTQTSLYPILVADLIKTGAGATSSDAVYLREMWSQLRPVMTAFQEVWHQIARHYGMYQVVQFFPLHALVNAAPPYNSPYGTPTIDGDPPYDSTVTTYQTLEAANINSLIAGTLTLNGNGTQWVGFQNEAAVGGTPAAIQSFTSSTVSVTAGQAVTFTFSYANATSAHIIGNDGSDRDVTNQTTATIIPTVNPTIYHLHVLDTNTNTTADSSTISIAVIPAAVAPVITSFTTSANPILAGQPVTLAWSTTGGVSANVQRVGGSGGSRQPVNGSLIVTPPTQPTTTYRLSVTNPQGTVTQDLVITVNTASLLPTVVAHADPPAIPTDGSVASSLTWITTNTPTSLRLTNNQDSTSVELINLPSYLVTPAVSTIYTVTPISSAGTGTPFQLTVNVLSTRFLAGTRILTPRSLTARVITNRQTEI